ncbi:MAG TPA: hypothetical protein VN747_04285 [Burkholderiales bacterium]|nr:hypothetical protein [Burkholderiales bacterium]
MIQATKSVGQIVSAIHALDLDPIKLKMMDAEEGQGWTREYVDRVELAYRRFLTLLVRFPEETIAPSKDVDKFWHGHILDTLKYAEDCERVFGYFLHHFPYFGMRGEEDAANLRDASARMRALYEREFGESMPSGSAWCMAAQKASAWCMAAKPEGASAWCMASRPESAWCMAAKPASASAWCMAARPSRADVNLRPTLAQAG